MSIVVNKAVALSYLLKMMFGDWSGKSGVAWCEVHGVGEIIWSSSALKIQISKPSSKLQCSLLFDRISFRLARNSIMGTWYTLEKDPGYIWHLYSVPRNTIGKVLGKPRIARMLAPGGKLVLDSNDVAWLYHRSNDIQTKSTCTLDSLWSFEVLGFPISRVHSALAS